MQSVASPPSNHAVSMVHAELATATASWTKLDQALLAVCALAPGALAVTGIASTPPASHDDAVVRVVGLGFTGIFRGLDVLVSAPAMLFPFGTRAFRAGLASALVVAACGALLFVLARKLAVATRPVGSRALVSVASAVAALTATLSAAWQLEATAPGGSVLGALIVLAAVWSGTRSARETPRELAFITGLAASYEPLVFAGVLFAFAPRFIDLARKTRSSARKAPLASKSLFVELLVAFALGLSPLTLVAIMLRRPPEASIAGARIFASPFGDRAIEDQSVTQAFAFLAAEIGTVILLGAAVGGIVAWVVPRARPMLESLVGVTAAGALAVVLRAPLGMTHAASLVLAAIAVVHLLLAVALVTVVVEIARVRVPFAPASAALVLVLEMVLPVRAADEAIGRRASKSPNASAIWNEIAWSTAPPAAAILVADETTMRRIAAARAVGRMRDDLLVVPTFAWPSRATDRALVAEPLLAPLYRDLALGSTPEELSLARLAAQRPLLASFDPRWDRAIARHFVPVGLGTRFEAEPRGATDRRRALEAFAPDKERLLRAIVVRRDPELVAATASLLRSRAITMAACGDRDVLSLALDDLRPFAPSDPVANALVRRIVTTKGPIDVKDLPAK